MHFLQEDRAGFGRHVLFFVFGYAYETDRDECRHRNQFCFVVPFFFFLQTVTK